MQHWRWSIGQGGQLPVHFLQPMGKTCSLPYHFLAPRSGNFSWQSRTKWAFSFIISLNVRSSRQKRSKRKLPAVLYLPVFYLQPLGVFIPSHLKTPPDYTLPAAPLAGSPCNHWYITCTLCRISGVTFEVTKFQIFRGSAPDPLRSLQRKPRHPSWWEGLAAPPQEPRLATLEWGSTMRYCWPRPG